uniref:Secreted protein n=1 Tax=Amphiprion ocellaris TaxID=80972 RepID=A0A3Q1C381_AMPOC
MACVTALERTFLSESLALLLNCLASLTRFSLCSRVTLQGKGGNVRKEKTVLGCVSAFSCVWLVVCVYVCDRLTSGKLLIWLRGNFPESKKERKISRLPGEVRMLRLRVKSSLSALRTAVMSSFTSSRLMMSCTRAELIFTLADWPFALAWKEGKH